MVLYFETSRVPATKNHLFQLILEIKGLWIRFGCLRYTLPGLLLLSSERWGLSLLYHCIQSFKKSLNSTSVVSGKKVLVKEFVDALAFLPGSKIRRHIARDPLEKNRSKTQVSHPLDP